MLDSQELFWTRKRNGVVDENETEQYIRDLEKRIFELEELERCHKTINGELIRKLNELGGNI